MSMSGWRRRYRGAELTLNLAEQIELSRARRSSQLSPSSSRLFSTTVGVRQYYSKFPTCVATL